jgi:hypothetical protein
MTAFAREKHRKEVQVPPRIGTLLVPVPGLSGTVYDVGTTVLVTGSGASLDAFVGGDWLPLQWWEFAETGADPRRDNRSD